MTIIYNQICDYFKIRRKPRVIQLPITSKCNSRCVTCNVWKVRSKIDISADNLREALQDPYFSKVHTIGINGGELTLVKDIDSIIDAVLSVKSLRSIHVISNGLLPKRLLELMSNLKAKSNRLGVRLGLTLSVDGYGKVHEDTRGIPNCFSRTIEILDEFRDNGDRYYDSFNIGCTVSTSNIAYIKQTEEFLKKYPFKVYYHLAVPNKRIHTFEKADYYVLNNQRSKLLAEEFFFSQFQKTSLRVNPIDKFRAYANYRFLFSNGTKRLAQCQYKYRNVTIDENMDMAYCATASDVIGSLNESKPLDLIRSDKGKSALDDIKKNCSTCVHYSDLPTLSGGLEFVMALLRERKRMHQFKHHKLFS